MPSDDVLSLGEDAPSLGRSSENNEQIDRLLGIMAKLRDPETGCQWDLAQSFKTIAPYTIEEAYEVFEAIEREDLHELKDELGDLLFQVVFHARMAEEAGEFSFHDVAQSISDKMEARHPHIFGDQSGEMTERRWEALKEGERSAKGAESALDGVALALPAAMRAQKLQKRAARVGFDWPDTDGPKSKILEELEELEAATSQAEMSEEAGDFLFAAVNLVRAYGVDAEEALRSANLKFERRFKAMEKIANGKFASLSLEEQEELWVRVKSEEKSA
ncbi:nucleoside triphosphate pyrophosphohydrolase [Altererythrobacter lutimaris]|uniref:Nucleoside triphosphate pyrophosphohydrolase n=1 Tax=Altererythrobacter lutimaris TaxID=2743979 RepID=A0A850H8A6_9SPHN|nr:nucleoside triphosphate pyrophosphohydrolase [Altererythrobacter lutimaris]NVE94019.1 nucleoside triphosphate pyrophosphohydrolase [Altererythrobacter lutimaris]